MSKRFTASEKWDKPWHRRLPPRLKCFWCYICTKCDMAGVWEPDFGLASYQIGEDVMEDDIAAFGGRIQWLPSGKLFVRGFVAFQYGTLKGNAPVHIRVLETLRKHGIGYDAHSGPTLGPRVEEEEEAKEEAEEGEGEL
jgi:hypothetical protein